jgi:hypothetical protein
MTSTRDAAFPSRSSASGTMLASHPGMVGLFTDNADTTIKSAVALAKTDFI